MSHDTIHLVQTQWHYNQMTAAGFRPVTPSDIGLVRRYVYERDGHQMALVTGVNADYWEDLKTGAFGYHGSLSEHLEAIK